MNVLQRFERRLGGIVEGAFAKVFRGGVEPVEIAGALARECDDRKAISAVRVLVPNEFTVELGRADHERLAPYAEPLGDELAAMVREHAQEQGYSFIGPVRVSLARDEGLSVGTFRVRSGVARGVEDKGLVEKGYPEKGYGEKAARPPDPPVEVIPAPPPIVAPPIPVGATVGAAMGDTAAVPAPVPARLVSQLDGQEHRLTGERLRVGRAPESDLRLTDPGVSRRHAELSRVDGAWWLTDLGSTNGSRVNDQLVSRARLADGDRVELGPVLLVFREGPRT